VPDGEQDSELGESRGLGPNEPARGPGGPAARAPFDMAAGASASRQGHIDQTASGWAMTLTGNFEWHRAVRESSQHPRQRKNTYNTKLESEVAAWFHTKPLRLDATLYTAAWIPTCRFRIVILAGASARTDRDLFVCFRAQITIDPSRCDRTVVPHGARRQFGSSSAGGYPPVSPVLAQMWQG
jgi:hypothetical protein